MWHTVAVLLMPSFRAFIPCLHTVPLSGDRYPVRITCARLCAGETLAVRWMCGGGGSLFALLYLDRRMANDGRCPSEPCVGCTLFQAGYTAEYTRLRPGWFHCCPCNVLLCIINSEGFCLSPIVHTWYKYIIVHFHFQALCISSDTFGTPMQKESHATSAYRIPNKGFYRVAALGQLWEMTSKHAQQRLKILGFFSGLWRSRDQ